LSETEAKYVKALDAPDYISFRKYRVEEPAGGTCQWFLHDKSVHAWLSEDKPSFLWVRGAPGQGKTVLSKFLLDHLECQSPNPQYARVIYFFFYDQDERFQTVNSLLRSLIKQLLTAPELSG
jgi:Cdc6-like AAA superfamily ATPase